MLLDHGADPNIRDNDAGYTPLHNAILGYHVQRVNETCQFIDALLEQGKIVIFISFQLSPMILYRLRQYYESKVLHNTEVS